MREVNAEKIRILIVTVLIFFMFVMIVARLFQLSILSGEQYKILSSMSREAGTLGSELAGGVNRITAGKEKIDESLKALEQKLMVSKKSELLKDMGDLRLQHQKLIAEVQNLQERVKDLSALEEKTVKHILDAYERALKKQRKFEFIINFILGVFSSIIASLLYSLAAEYKVVPKIALRNIFRKIPIVRRLFQNVQAS